MRKTRISDNWFFAYAGGKQTRVTLPHDMVVGLERTPDSAGAAYNGFWPGAEGAYVRYLPYEGEAATILDVDGAYMCAEITLNEENLGVHPHGYTPYLTELTPYMKADGVNKLKIHVAALQPSSRWYAGGGLYRDVFLWTGGSVRIEPWDLFVTTTSGSGEMARVSVQGLLTADLDARAKLCFLIRDAEGRVVSRGETTVTASSEEQAPFYATLEVEAPHLWDVDDPYLYTLETEVYGNGCLTDRDTETFGIRTMQWDAEHGFRLNGKCLKLRGGCIHHDHGVLGGASYPAAEERKIRLLKAAGFNAVRIAHNPPSLALLEVCDRLGMLMMDEAFDMWRQPKRPLDYHLWFEDWWDTDIACMVRRDRNHPCVASYSIGNEIWERDCSSRGAEWSALLSAEIRRYDDTRPVTSAICGMWNAFDDSDPQEYRLQTNGGTLENLGDGRLNGTWNEQIAGYAAPLDIVGYNYLYKRYEQDHVDFPQRVMWGSETHAIHIYDSWDIIKRSPWVCGDFTWTAYDNLGEAGTGRWSWARDGVINGISAGPWPWRSCYQGDLDLCGYRRPQSFYRETVWGLRHEPAIFTTHPEHTGEGFTGTEWHWYDVHDTWSFDAAYLGKPVKTEVYTDADEVEFLLNGVSLGRVPAERLIATLEIPYAPGTLTAVAYTDGRETGRSSLVTVGVPTALSVHTEHGSFTADGRDLCWFRICVEDVEGRRVTESKAPITVSVTGGRLLGVFSGDPANEDRYGSDTCHAFDGRALAIVAADAPGAVTLTAASAGLLSGTDKAQAKA